MDEWIFRLFGIILIIVGALGALAILGEVNPLSFISDPLFNLTMLFLTDVASFLFWIFILIIGLFLVGPRRGYMRSIVRRVR